MTKPVYKPVTTTEDMERLYDSLINADRPDVAELWLVCAEVCKRLDNIFLILKMNGPE